MEHLNRPRRISQTLREIQEKVLYENCRFSWEKESGNNGLTDNYYWDIILNVQILYMTIPYDLDSSI